MVFAVDRCWSCGAVRERRARVLCDACVDGVVAGVVAGDGGAGGAVELCPEQISARRARPEHGHHNAFLVDAFGQPHALSVPTSAAAPFRTVSIGREKKSDLMIAERTVSLRHAQLEHRPLSNAWFVVDNGSENGVRVGDDVVPRRFPLEPGDRVYVGRRVGFVFVVIDDDDVDAVVAELQSLEQQSWSEDTVGDAGSKDVAALKVAVVTEGGGVATVGRARVSLTELEVELLVQLHQRYIDDDDKDAAARGFVPAAVLLDVLSFRSEAPTHANLRGLVRKLRKKLADHDDAVDVIESRQGLGYRLARPLALS